MADNKVNFLRGTSAEYEASTKDNDTFYYTTDTKKLYLGETEITGIEIDDTSTTATDKTWSAKKISDSIPTTLPANGGNADTFAENSIDKFLKYNGIATDCNECTTRGVYQASSSTLNTPGIFYLTDRTPILITFDGSFQLFFTGVELYSRAYCIDPHGVNSPYWSDWRNVADDGNASTVGGKNLTSIMNLGYHWEDRTQITDGDLDTYVDGGRYLVLSSDVAKNILHTPWTTSGYYLDIYHRTSTHVIQVAMRYEGQVKIRTITGGSWSDWKNIANGGDADTVDGKHANEFMQFLGDVRNGSLLDYILNLDKSGFLYCGSTNCTDMPVNGTYFMVEVRCYTTVKEVKATSFNTGAVYTNCYSGSKWLGWTNVANGGNADTVDGKHASDFTLSYIRNNKPLVTSILPLEKTARLTWLPVDGATAYAVALYIDGKYVNQSKEITNTYYDIQGLTPGTVYLALVQAYVNGSWSKFTTDDLVHFYTLPVASATSDGLVTTGSQTFAGYKTFQNNVYIQHSEYTKSSTAPSTKQFKAYRFSDKANKQVGEFSNYIDTNNNTVSKMLAVAATSLDGKRYSQIATIINADASYIRHVCTPPTTGQSSLRQMASGTAEATTSNCPDGAWYGKHS